MVKYWLDIHDNDETWTFYEFVEDTEGDIYNEEVASGSFSDIPGYYSEAEGDWDPFDLYFKKEYGIDPEEWVVG